MTFTLRTLARVTVWTVLPVNVWAVTESLVAHDYGVTAWASLVLGVLTAWLHLGPTIEAWLDAKVDEADARVRMAKIALDEVLRARAHGDVRVTVCNGAAAPSDRAVAEAVIRALRATRPN